MSRRTSLATRKQRGDAEELRKHVQIGQLIDRLIAHVCSPKPLMDESQVQSALLLLNKVLPGSKRHAAASKDWSLQSARYHRG